MSRSLVVSEGVVIIMGDGSKEQFDDTYQEGVQEYNYHVDSRHSKYLGLAKRYHPHTTHNYYAQRKIMCPYCNMGSKVVLDVEYDVLLKELGKV